MTSLGSSAVGSSRLGRRDELTFRANLKATRYGWLRLTPAYSVHLVGRLLDENAGRTARVLDPFCGTGTTALVCAERGLSCTTTDINPFLLWLATAKTRKYAAAEIAAFEQLTREVARASRRERSEAWVPALHKIERWWSPKALSALGRARAEIHERKLAGVAPAGSLDLLEVAFCRAMIESAHVSFGHQSMSFRGAGPALADDNEEEVGVRLARAAASISVAAASPIRKPPTVKAADARELESLAATPKGSFDCIVTSPPYPNRMSYVRELRPYMYWLGYLEGARDAGELDWRAIGGTWGCATSNVAKWSPPAGARVAYEGFDAITIAIAERSDLLARYIRKYFHDTAAHLQALFARTASGGSIHYIVGNSKFYDVMLPVEQIYASLLAWAGFEDVRVATIRKRTSKKELFEYVVSARKR